VIREGFADEADDGFLAGEVAFGDRVDDAFQGDMVGLFLVEFEQGPGR